MLSKVATAKNKQMTKKQRKAHSVMMVKARKKLAV